ncbi:MAG TPA: type II secretion system ATPase GspE [Stellaceae bacterium]|nr:type II secretion system ATPase GspE [Stellaceae bacterium]
MLGNGSDRGAFERSLIERLVDAGKLDQPAADRALRLRAASAERLEALLIKLGLVSERDVAETLARELGLPLVAPPDYPDAVILEDKISRKFLRQVGVLPLAETAEGIVVAMTDPLDGYAAQALEMAAGRPVLRQIALPSELEAAQARLFDSERSEAAKVADAAQEGSDEDLLEDVDRLRDLASEGPVIRLVSQIMNRAIEQRASDIHIEPFQNRLAVRYRIDGMLHEAGSPPARLRAAIISRVKIMAKLNIAERRLPQDGRIRLAIQGRDYDLRVSSVPTLHGESVVMRILDRTSLVEDLTDLGFSEETLPPFLGVLERPQGILLVTGPTGSGKTTTLYTSLMRLNSPEKKLFTVEDPIEYQLEGVNQVQIKPQIGLSFAQVLRSILRQDPDIIMIGEIRDLETAQIAIQAALTGHLVLSTLHTNSAAATVTRLLDMGVEDYLVTSTISGVLAQRLVRRLCPTCREPYQVLPELAQQLRLDPRTARLYRPRGCELCSGTGYSGRVAVMELLTMSDALRRLILKHAESNELHRVALQEGMRSMYEDGVAKACAGITSIEEVFRVTRDV